MAVFLGIHDWLAADYSIVVVIYFTVSAVDWTTTTGWRVLVLLVLVVKEILHARRPKTRILWHDEPRRVVFAP